MQQAPSLLVIDGGKGQLRAAIKALIAEEISDQWLLGIAKGKTRKAEFEQYFISHYQAESPCVIEQITFLQPPFLLQKVRDAAHQFAIQSMRKRLQKSGSSQLAQIPGVGVKRQKQLLIYFGSLECLKQASVADIAKAPDIGLTTANSIKSHLLRA